MHFRALIHLFCGLILISFSQRLAAEVEPAPADSAAESPSSEATSTETASAEETENGKAVNEDAIAPEEEVTEEEVTEEEVTEEEVTEDPSVTQVEPQEAFAALFEQWKSRLKKIREVGKRYADIKGDSEAERAEQNAIRNEFQQLISQGEDLLIEMRSVGIAAHKAAPHENRQVTKFLMLLIEDDCGRDDYEPAAELARLLLEDDPEETSLYNWAGVAQFCTNQFEEAEENLSKASARSGLSDRGQTYFDLVGEYQTYWASERKIQEQEQQKGDLPQVCLETSKGEIVIALFEDQAPNSVANFISLIEKGFYNGLTFHRVLEGFMAQGGCPEGTGSGGPGYNIPCECIREDHRKHFRGSLSMAHAGQDTGGSQFFLTFVPTSHLNERHTVFGRVIEGMDVLSKLQRRDPSGTSSLEPDRILKAEVISKRDHPYEPTKTGG